MGRKAIIATCSLNQFAMDFDNNSKNIIASIEIAKSKGATYRVGPELEITGYGCSDHFLEGDTLLHSMQVLRQLLLHPTCTYIMVDVGMPVMQKNIVYNCRIIFLNKKILLIRPKMILAGGGNYRESRWFTGWAKPKEVEDYFLPSIISEVTGQRTVKFGDALISTLDTCIGCEICEEMWNPASRHIEMAFDGVEIVVNSSGSYHELRKAYVRVDLIKSASKNSCIAYVFSNLLGCDGERVYYDGCSAIAVGGEILAQGPQFSFNQVEVTTAVIDLEDIRSLKNSFRSRCQLASSSIAFPRIEVDFALTSNDAFLESNLPIQWSYLSAQEEISLGPACWMWDYLRRSGASGFFLPLSGGIDSSSVACLVASMCKQLVSTVNRDHNSDVLEDIRKIVSDSSYNPTCSRELCSRLLTTCYMATKNSSDGTKQSATGLADEIGSYHIDVKIDSVVSGILSIFETLTGLKPKFKVHGGTIRENTALQNVQARVRMVLSYLFAQLSLWSRGRPGGLLVLASANVDESLRGYMTKYDCSSADINPIGGISKTDLKSFILYCIDHFEFKSLKKVYNAAPTAELEPLVEGQVAQLDEVDMGMTYDELTAYGALRMGSRCGPYSMFSKLVPKWKENLSPFQVAEKVKSFFRYYSINRHKMTVLTPSYHAEYYGPDDNRHDLRQFLYNPNWSWQFRYIDEQAKILEEKYRK